ncbi:N-6 DNA methylase [Muricauda sp. CAU 1633]|uniref:restriction endonuclease subunit M n=1 Tax=Allomuricauda sp. CAU 1633 TaxID=2816036 RepID=UPI001A8D8B7A|nr:N-6 DNA methylase [Muricauda sp. CAU 1633]MBO0324048.1 N-6 DNA methylase [Muricauda sp. CAU 1633]
MNILERGIQKGLIKFDADKKFVIYVHQNKKRNFINPEERVQAETFCTLVLRYNYPVERITNYVPVKMGSETKEADLVVYNDDKLTEPHILIECKKPDISEQEFNQAIEQAYSYAYALPNDVKYVWVTKGNRNEYFKVNKKKLTREPESDIPQFGVKTLANYKFVFEADEMPIESGKQKFFDLTEISQEELTRRFKQAHDALWAGGHLNPSEAFDELDKLIFCKIWDERKDRQTGEPYDFQIIQVEGKDERDSTRKTNEALYRRVTALYEEGRKKDKEVFRDNIRLSPEKVRTIVGYLQDINLGETDLDSKGRAFETFMDSFFRGNFGQYFTPRPVVDFSVNVLPIKNDSYVLDTSCGSGGFLLYALNKVRKQADELYPRYKTDVIHSKRHFKYWHDFAENNLFGIEINEQISRAAKMNMIIHDDGHTNVITSDGLLNEEEIARLTTNRGFKYNHFDFIITNPPFGSSIKKSEKSYLKNYFLGKKQPDWLDLKGNTNITTRNNQSTEVLFIEQCYKFLRPGGYLAMVVPDGILTNSSMQYVRDAIEEWYRIVAVVSMPSTTFSATGAGVKSSVIFLKKHSLSTTEKIQSIKLRIQTQLKSEYEFYETISKWDSEKKKELKEMKGLHFTMPFSEFKKTEEYKEWRSSINSKYSEKINLFKEELQDAYLEKSRAKLPDYSIFMAIAEDIGYDATGKATQVNELNWIGKELTNFINHIESNPV